MGLAVNQAVFPEDVLVLLPLRRFSKLQVQPCQEVNQPSLEPAPLGKEGGHLREWEGGNSGRQPSLRQSLWGVNPPSLLQAGWEEELVGGPFSPPRKSSSQCVRTGPASAVTGKSRSISKRESKV